ncbi:MAG: SUMF1/EgtB/PvdO family nonheme iron enzyme [Gemmataceae bacterium]|nr:SUMF1/EgtB/PvdO family nonheme iron enzyme [Gemmataceae bacterium]
MHPHLRFASSFLFIVAIVAPAAEGDETALHKAVTFYASFDDQVQGDYGGDRKPWTRSVDPDDKKKFVYEKGIDAKLFRIAREKGISGGCLEVTELPPRNGRLYFPAQDNVAFKNDAGWGGAFSVWINTDPDKSLKTPFSDPLLITQKGLNNGSIWVHFNDAKPRALQSGTYPSIPDGQKPLEEDDPKAPLVRMKDVGFKSGEWHHIVLTWDHFNSGKKDGTHTLYIDGKKIGDVKDYPISMDWDIGKANVYVGVNFIGLLDELALFNRPLTADEVALLHKKPGVLAKLKKSASSTPDKQLLDLEKRLNVLNQKKPTDVPAPPKFPFDATAARKYQKDCAAALGLPVEFTNSLGMTFVLVPPGTFTMGSPEKEPGHNSGGYDETQFQATLTRPFYLCKHETTVGQFRRFVEATKYVTDVEKKGGGHAHDDKAVWIHRKGTEWRKPGFAGPFELKDDQPVVHVSHADCLAFCKWLQEQSGVKADGPLYGLPTEAQWEWACRAGSGTRFWWGADEDKTGKVANVGDKSLKKVHPEWPRSVLDMDDGFAFVAPVGSYQANGFGLHDMLGNVWEHCGTHYGPYPKEGAADPGDLDVKRGFAVRGGGWSNVANDARCASRNADPPNFGHSNLGFRVALQLPFGGAK